MPHFGWSGPGELRQMDMPRAKTPELDEPSGPDVEGGDDRTQVFVCTADECGRKFKKRMILARHFNASHESLREDKDSWREYAEEEWI